MTRTLVAILILVLASPTSGDEADKKPPVPDQAAQAAALKLVKEVYGPEIAAAKTAEEKKALAKKLVAEASDVRDDRASKFVLLKVGKTIAVQALDGQTAFDAIDKTAEAFEFDRAAAKQAVLEALAQKAHSSAEHASIAERALEVADQTQDEEKFEAAAEIVELALAEARSSRDPQLLRQAQQRKESIERIAELAASAKTASAVLEKTPDDPQANLVAGKYHCLVRNDWDKGIPMLALGSDADLKSAAALELKGAASSSEQTKIGDAWWTLAEKEKGIAKKPFQTRAKHWYEQAQGGLSGLTKDKVEKRIESLASLEKPSDAPVKPKDAFPTRVRIINRNSGLCLALGDVNVKAKEAVLVQQTIERKALDQIWRMEKVEGYYRLVNLKSHGCIAVSQASKTPGVGVIVRTEDRKAPEQQWQLKPATEGFYVFMNRNSGLCIGVPGGSTSAGAATCQWPFRGAEGVSQQWRLEAAQ